MPNPASISPRPWQINGTGAIRAPRRYRRKIESFFRNDTICWCFSIFLGDGPEISPKRGVLSPKRRFCLRNLGDFLETSLKFGRRRLPNGGLISQTELFRQDAFGPGIQKNKRD